jgi:hypothetical protein
MASSTAEWFSVALHKLVEQATRALFAGNLSIFQNLIEGWPKDIQEHFLSLAEANVTRQEVRMSKGREDLRILEKLKKSAG